MAEGLPLAIEGLEAFYGDSHVLHGVTLDATPGEAVTIIGRNGAGKTTTLRAIMGLLPASSGRITLDGEELARRAPHEIPALGVAYVPQGRRLFPFLSVEENLRMGLLVRRGDRQVQEDVLGLFPVLRERLHQQAGTLSGGEQQMLATARALCARPRFLLMDEPTEGLAPLLVGRLLETVGALRARGVGVLLVEQKVEAALRVANRVALIESGRIAEEGTAEALAARPEILLRYVGVRR
jgi:branched-chain amino acid transport system ATP-binding protein